MPLNRIAYGIIGAAVVAVIAVMIVTLAVPGSNLGSIAMISDPDSIITNKDCGAAARLAVEDLEDATLGQQLGMLKLYADCIDAEEIESISDIKETMSIISKNIKYEWPESAGNSPDNPIKLPYTLDENYMTSDSGIGGCEITINSVDLIEASFEDMVYLNMEVMPVRDIEYCQLNGIDDILEEHKKNDKRAQGSKETIIKNGDILVGIRVNTNYPDRADHISNTMLGFVRTAYEDQIRFSGTLNDRSNLQPRWHFGEDDAGVGSWSPGVGIQNSETVRTGWDLFAGYTFTSYDRYPTNIEFVFVDASKLDEIEGDLVGFMNPDIQYSKYFAIGS